MQVIYRKQGEHEVRDLFHDKVRFLTAYRVVTISNGDRCEVFGALLCMGAHGSVIDNTLAGGMYAPINVEMGTKDITAIDAHDDHYDAHPDTGKQIKGFLISEWERIMSTCKEASRIILDIHFASWDFCENQAGQLVFIEGNHALDFYRGMQLPLRQGGRWKLKGYLDELYGIGNMI